MNEWGIGQVVSVDSSTVTAFSEPALARPLNIHAYGPDADIATLAAAYAFGIVKNHPLLDGYKRTGYVVTEAFVYLNGRELKADGTDKYPTFIALAAGTLPEHELAAWLRRDLA
ncbi:hypothetical protein BH10ACI3_BH10ACI3_04850 [soil metagenome]